MDYEAWTISLEKRKAIHIVGSFLHRAGLSRNGIELGAKLVTLICLVIGFSVYRPW